MLASLGNLRHGHPERCNMLSESYVSSALPSLLAGYYQRCMGLLPFRSATMLLGDGTHDGLTILGVLMRLKGRFQWSIR